MCAMYVHIWDVWYPGASIEKPTSLVLFFFALLRPELEHHVSKGGCGPRTRSALCWGGKSGYPSRPTKTKTVLYMTVPGYPLPKSRKTLQKTKKNMKKHSGDRLQRTTSYRYTPHK